MTVDTTGTAGGGDVVAWTGDDNLGFEDIDATDLSVPRLKILHKKAKFLDPAKVERSQMNVIMLGVVKQRIFWPSKLEDNDLPLCKSNDHERGFPAPADARKPFPWAQSNFNPADFPPDPQGRVVLPCEKCIFKEWDKNDWKQPPCNEIWAVPLMYQPDPDNSAESWAPAVLQFSKTGIKPIRQYASFFVGQRVPMFTSITSMGLTAESRGQNDYAVPNFSRLGQSPDANWAEYGAMLKQIRSFIRTDPRSSEPTEPGDDAPASSTTVVQEPVQQTAQAPVTEDPWATAREASAAAAETSDLPF